MIIVYLNSYCTRVITLLYSLCYFNYYNCRILKIVKNFTSNQKNSIEDKFFYLSLYFLFFPLLDAFPPLRATFSFVSLFAEANPLLLVSLFFLPLVFLLSLDIFDRIT